MNFSRLALMVLAAGVVALGCQADSGSLPSDPAAVELADNADAQTKKSIKDVCFGRDRGAAISSYQHAVNEERKGNTAGAQAQAIQLVLFIAAECDGDPVRKAEVITEILLRFGLVEPGDSIDPGAFGTGAGFGICTSEEDCTVLTTPEPFGAVFMPEGFCHSVCVVSIIPIDDSFDPFLTAGEESFPKRFDIEVIGPHGDDGSESLALADHDETLHATVGVCVVDEEVEEADVSSDDLRLARLVEEGEGAEVEELPLVDPPAGLAEDCETISDLSGWQRALYALAQPVSSFLVKPLYASPGGLGGAVINFSPFAAIECEECDDEGPTPTTTTLTPAAAVLFPGGVETMTATVDPAPDSGDEPEVRFVIDEDTEGEVEFFRFLNSEGEATLEIACGFDESETADHVVGFGEHTVKAYFLGTDSHDASESGVSIITCEAFVPE
jgi:hypothetical protein